jgi:hypothetical protein
MKQKTIMEITPAQKPAESLDVYNFAADLLVNRGNSTEQVKKALIDKGVEKERANTIVNELEDQIAEAKKSSAKKDILYGSLWCVGGLILTIFDTGFIFWGAIVFGGIQLIKGLINSNS